MRMGKIEELREQAQIAMGNMQALERAYDFADDDMKEALAYKIKGYQKEYEALARRLKKEVFNTGTQITTIYADDKKILKILNFFK